MLPLSRFFSIVLRALPPEAAHLVGKRLLNFYYSCFDPRHKKQSSAHYEFCGLSFTNRVGLAAGWDKDGECIDALFRLGFGFVEVGTVTPKPQRGNPKPRLFRIAKKKALINRMGFNNQGVDALVQRLKRRRESGVLGVNIGKNALTPLESAADDYCYCLEAVFPYADYIVINISSPNTPGLRSLQSASYLEALLKTIVERRDLLEAKHKKKLPVFVKSSVDLKSDQLPGFIDTLITYQVAGIIVSNTTVDHSAVQGLAHAGQQGGLSGAPLHKRNLALIKKISELAKGQLMIIGVGGILSKTDAKAYFQAGASLVQLYTGFVYEGPQLISECCSVV